MKPGRGPVLSGLLFVICLVSSTLNARVSEAFIAANRDRLDELFTQLDPAHEDISTITTQWQSGDRVAAATALCEYYKGKDFPMELLDPPTIPRNVIEQADAAIEKRFFLLNEWEAAPLTTTGSIDWEGRGARNDKERAWMLNRNAFVLNLAEAAKLTGDSRYNSALNELWQDWILQNPYPNRLSFSAPWRALEVARRILNSWVYVFYGYDVLDDETRLLVLCSILDHADSLSEHASSWGGNHLITEKMALLTTAVAWPEFRQAGQWRTDSIRDISREFISQTYPDGSYKELSNHYQRVVLTSTIRFLKLIESGEQTDTQVAVGERIEKMWDFFAGVMRPDGFGPLNNAADNEHNASFVREVWEQFNRPDWLFMASNGTEGPAPSGPEPDPSRLFPWAGQAILRTGWDRDAGWIYFDAGPYGTAHQHIDWLHVSATLKGRPLLVDNGRYIYQPGPWKEYFQGPASHNILLLNGQASEQAPRKVDSPLPVAFEQRDSVAYASASAQFPPSSSLPLLPSLRTSTPWNRSILLDQRGRFALIIDHVVSFRTQNWTAQWHFDPGLSEEEAERALTLVAPADSVRSLVRIGAGPPDVAGFHSPEYNVKQPAVQMDVSGNLDRPTTLVWLLQSPDAPDIHVQILSKPGDPILHLQVREADLLIAETRLQLHPSPALISYKAF
jgi:hypothetical protein